MDSNLVNDLASITACPRCGGEIHRSHYEPSCFQCGYVDYQGSTAQFEYGKRGTYAKSAWQSRLWSEQGE